MHIPFNLNIKIPFDWIKGLIQKARNYLFRPRLKLELKQQTVVFVSQDRIDHHYKYFCLMVSNCSRKNHYINLRQLKINNESYQVIIQMEPNFNKIRPGNNESWLDCKNEIYKLYSSNWLDICENRFTHPIQEFKTLIFPMKLLKAASHYVTGYKKFSYLFFPKSKINITIELNGKIYEYGLKRKDAYERYINYLAFNQD